MTARPTLLLFCLLTLRSAASPGEILPLDHPTLRAIGSVGATAITENGEVFIAGDFDQVNGIPRPGLAKLTQNGTLDQSFQPTVTPANLPLQYPFPINFRPLQNTTFWNSTSPFSFQTQPGNFENLQLFDLGRGRLFMRHQQAWTILDSSGEIDTNALPSFSRNEPAPVPQFRHGNQLFLINHENQLLAINLANNDALDESFTLDPSFAGSITQAVAATDGVWILSQQGQFNVVCHLLPDGNLDPTFPPLELRDGQSHRLSSNSFSGFAITTYPGISPITCTALGGCGEPINRVKLQWFSEIGSERSETQISTRGFTNPLLLPQSSSRTIYQSNGFWYLRFPTGEPIPLNQIEKPSPNGSLDLPLQIATVDEFKSGFQRSLLIGGTRVFNQSGQPSNFWQVPNLSKTASISQVSPLADGSYFISGDFRKGLVKVRPDRTIDSSFQPTIDLRFLQEFEVKQNGEIFALLKEPFLDADLAPHWLLRLSATGELQQSYLESIPEGHSQSYQIELLSDQSLIFGNSSQTYIFSFNNGALVDSNLQRIKPDGSLDSDWKMSQTFSTPGISLISRRDLLYLAEGNFLLGRQKVSISGAVTPGIPGEGNVQLFGQDADGWVYFTNTPSFYLPISGLETSLRRWHPENGLDPDFAFSPGRSNYAISRITFGSRRKLYLHGSFTTTSGQRTLIRLHHTGQIDHSFREPKLHVSTAPNLAPQILTSGGLFHTSDTNLVTTAQASFGFAHDDQLFLFGAFNQPSNNSITVKDTHVSGFDEWITATTGSVQKLNDDYDQDGATNLEEYALGSDPAFPDLAAHRIAHESPSVFEVPCNPEAPEVIRELEVSFDLANWNIANASEITLETRAGCLRYRLDTPRPRIFSRIRYSLR